MNSGGLDLGSQYWKNRPLDNLEITYSLKTADAELIHAHLEECSDQFKPPLDEKVDIRTYSKKLFDRSLTFEAWSGQYLVGLIAAYFNDVETGSGYITSVSTAENYQGQGIATELMTRCINYAQQNRFDKISLEVSNENNEAIEFYKKFGFLNIEKMNDALIMRVEIDKTIV